MNYLYLNNIYIYIFIYIYLYIYLYIYIYIYIYIYVLVCIYVKYLTVNYILSIAANTYNKGSKLLNVHTTLPVTDAYTTTSTIILRCDLLGPLLPL